MLDHDVQSGHGPETVTILPLDNVMYHLWIHNFSGSASLQSSKAQLQVYNATGLMADVGTIHVTTSGASTARMWHVCGINGRTGDVTIFNRVHDIAENDTAHIAALGLNWDA